MRDSVCSRGCDVFGFVSVIPFVLEFAVFFYCACVCVCLYRIPHHHLSAKCVATFGVAFGVATFVCSDFMYYVLYFGRNICRSQLPISIACARVALFNLLCPKIHSLLGKLFGNFRNITARFVRRVRTKAVAILSGGRETNRERMQLTYAHHTQSERTWPLCKMGRHRYSENSNTLAQLCIHYDDGSRRRRGARKWRTPHAAEYQKL